MRLKLAGGGAILAVVFILALAGVLVPADDTLRIAPGARLRPPTGEHLLGTDALGRDTLARLLVGTRATVQMCLAAMFAAIALGAPLGWLAARFSRWLGALVTGIAYVFFIAPAQLLTPSWASRILMAVCSSSLILPGGLLTAVAITLVHPGWFTTAIALGVLFAPAARLRQAAALGGRALSAP
jgi:peptide/nickel transport system permease protein